MVYLSEATGRLELYVQPFPQPGRAVQISQQGAVNGWWSRDGRQMVFLDDDLRSLWRAEIDTSSGVRAGAPVHFATLPPGVISVDASPDRQRFLAIAPERVGAGSLTIVQNWVAALKR
jgi:hypothetical protein